MNPRCHLLLAALAAAALVLVSAAWWRSAEYDEQYTLFLTGGAARPSWPVDAFPASEVLRLQAGHAGFAAIARDLRSTDVHPPLYFWTIAVWRMLVGNSLFAARLASVLFSLAALGVTAWIARLAGIPAVTSVLLTIGCYGFVYTGSIARGFALAQLLTLSGVALLLCVARRPNGWTALAAGALLGAATFANYLAAFVAAAALLWLALTRTVVAGKTRRCAGCAMIAASGFAAWLPADLSFYLAQRHSRAGQFAPFDAASSATRLARYLAANLLGGLPLYAGGLASHVMAALLAAVLAGLAGLTIARWRSIAPPGPRLLLTIAAAAPPVGLLVLGLVFDNTPIELRYLASATPFFGLLLAGMIATLPGRAGKVACGMVLAIQALSLVGLITRQETMQPARATAASASSLAGDGVVLLPYGNDGIGIVGAFVIEAPTTLPLVVVRRGTSAARIRGQVGRFPRVVVALLGQDADSRATLPVMLEALNDPCWREAGEGFNILAFQRICGQE